MSCETVRKVALSIVLIVSCAISNDLLAQGFDVFDELLARENIIGRWEGDKPTCLLNLIELFAGSRDGEIVVRRDGYILGLPTEVKWAIKTMNWEGVPRVTLVLWIKNEKRYEECMEGVDVSRKTIRFLDRNGVTYCKMRKAE
jgi:hypothetical protein